MINDQFLKWENVIETNIDLGKYHLKCGNVRDAIMRFKIARFFFDKENHEIHYWLGWCYFIQNKYELAKECLRKAGKSDEIKLGQFLEKADVQKEVPREIWHNIREITLCEGDEKYFSKDLYNNNIDMPLEYIEFFLNSVEELVHKPRILDYGCGNGLAGSYLDYKIDKEYIIDGVDSEEICLDYVKTIRGERGYVYDNVEKAYLDNPDKIFEKKKYDIIFSFNSLSFKTDLSSILKSFNKNLTRQGLVSVLLPTSSKTSWDGARRSYSFNTDEISEQFRLAKFDIIDIKEWSLGKNKKYVSIVARK